MKKNLLFFIFLFSNFFYAQVKNIENCAGNTSFNLTLQKSILIGNLNPAETAVSYHLSLSDATDGLNSIANPANYISTESSKTIYARIANNGTITTNYFSLIVNPILTAEAKVVYVDCVPRIVITGNGGNSNYEYSHFGVTYTQNNVIINPSPGNQTVYVRDGNGCIASKTLIIEPLTPLTWFANNIGVTCQGGSDGSITITASGGKAPYQYSIGNEFTNSNVFKNLSVGVYTVRIQDATGCIISYTFTMRLINTAISANPIITNDKNSTSKGQIEMIVSGGVTPYSYSLKNSNGILIPSKTTNPFKDLAIGSYEAIVTDSFGCTFSQKGIKITNEPTPLTTTVKVTPITCVVTTGSITITPNGGTLPYRYSIDNGTNYSNSNMFSNLAAGTYNIKVRDAQGLVISTVATLDSVNLPQITTTYKSILCQGDSNGSILVEASNGKSPNLFSINGSPYDSKNLFQNLSAGKYTLSVKDSNGCIVSKLVTLEDPAPITAEITILDRSLTINAKGGYGKYEYNLDGNGYQQSNIYSNLNYGNHIIYVRDPNGCLAVFTAALDPPSPLIEGKSILNIDFIPGQTLGDLIIEGQNIKWYNTSGNSSTGKTNKFSETTLPLTTILIDGTTYYASQTINEIESKKRLAVTAKLNTSLSTEDFILANFKYYPNPITHLLNISNSATIDEVEIIAVSGKSVFTKKINNTHSEIDLSNISSGFYFLKVKSERQTKTIKILKK
ncbi:T9SS type A sorting domain-containing protein [Flavobacterium plurextorum]|uniref:T9SS type A sorting domain-containing protein n=1 Tax=Flavobacterium plurextorum TaxID=1114867 RepID=UPI0037583651